MVTLTVTSTSTAWWVGFPYQPASDEQRAANPNRLYVLPTPELEQLAAWWRDRVEGPAGAKSRRQLLDRVDLAVRRQAPPVAFRLQRMQDVVREYPAA